MNSGTTRPAPVCRQHEIGNAESTISNFAAIVTPIPPPWADVAPPDAAGHTPLRFARRFCAEARGTRRPKRESPDRMTQPGLSLHQILWHEEKMQLQYIRRAPRDTSFFVNICIAI
ncbi:hypothetical protein C7S17_3916 [Burkholderia thailandensis]|nr:hypothetical protein [Burkholderia thailandensis]